LLKEQIEEMEQQKEQEEQMKQIQQVQYTLEPTITGENYRDCAKDRLCMLLENSKCEQTILQEHEPGTNKYCAIGAGAVKEPWV